MEARRAAGCDLSSGGTQRFATIAVYRKLRKLMYDLQLTAEQQEFRDAVRDFVAREIKPEALKSLRLESSDRTFPRELYALASQLGLRTLALSEAQGGAGRQA